MSEVWLETKSGLVRADAIVAVRVESRRLVVSLGVPTGGQGMGGWDIHPTDYIVGKTLPDADNPERILVEYLAWIRGRGENGVVVVSEGGVPVFESFD